MTSAVHVNNISHSFPASKHRKDPLQALDGVNLSVERGEIFGLLGPNGGGKTTLFRILSTLLRPSSGTAMVMDTDIANEPGRVREQIGVVFQSPSLDKNLTVEENLSTQGNLYGKRGSDLTSKIQTLLSKFKMEDRTKDVVSTLSGGLKRRVEIAKGVLHNPALLIMDEPSTGLDPKARRDVWDHLRQLKEEGLTVLLTTHLMEEAENCDRLGIINKGRMVAVGTPKELKQKIGGDVISIHSNEPNELSAKIQEKFSVDVKTVDDTLRIERDNGHTFIPQLVEAFPGSISSISVGKPTLEDVFIHMTGEDFWSPA